jgi:hypothetical protein
MILHPESLYKHSAVVCRMLCHDVCVVQTLRKIGSVRTDVVHEVALGVGKVQEESRLVLLRFLVMQRKKDLI